MCVYIISINNYSSILSKVADAVVVMGSVCLGVIVLLSLCSLLNTKSISDNEDFGDHGHYLSSRSKRNLNSEESPWMNTDWNALGRKRIQSIKTHLEKNSMKKKQAKNVILFLGDGMGLSSISAGRILKAQKNNLKREDIYLTWENFPHAGLARTYTVDRVTPDSAATATAFLSGVKTNFLTLGVNDKVKAANCSNIEGNELDSILHKSMDAGKWVGVVTTTTVTHASPGACYASTAMRTWEASVPDHDDAKNCKDIAYQLVHSDRNKDIRVIFGGGLSNFLPNHTESTNFENGLRTDDRNLIEEWLEMKKNKGKRSVLLLNKTDLDAFDPDNTDYVMGLFAKSHMEYEVTRDPALEPSLTEMTEKAIQVLRRSPDGFFLFVEAGRIDHGHHDSNAYRALHDVLELEKAVTKALALTDPLDTLILVTADHSHVFTMGGYSSFQESIFGFAASLQPALDGKPYTQLLYANGPGYKYHKIETQVDGTFKEVPRKNITNSSEVLGQDFQQDSAVWTEFETHGGEDVAVYATGPWSHLFQGTEEQSFVAHVMMFASCVGQYAGDDHCLSASMKLMTSLGLVLILLSIEIMQL